MIFWSYHEMQIHHIGSVAELGFLLIVAIATATDQQFDRLNVL